VSDADIAPTHEDILVLSGLQAGYGRKHVVFDVDLHLRAGEIVTIIGHNGAGKTTTLKTIFGMLPALGGTVSYRGDDVTHSSCRRNVLRGMSYIPAERFVFSDLSVLDNLRLGAMHEKSSEARESRMNRVYAMFPLLQERATQRAGTMSGGQQRMLSLGLAMMSDPKLLLLDEPSLGLAPALVAEIFAGVRRLADEEGLTVLLLEQNVGQALRIVDRAYVMRAGRIILEETADQMRRRPDYWDLF
jgi:branched-chain amino acid transport system ATP-binding protein